MIQGHSATRDPPGYIRYKFFNYFVIFSSCFLNSFLIFLLSIFQLFYSFFYEDGILLLIYFDITVS